MAWLRPRAQYWDRGAAEQVLLGQQVCHALHGRLAPGHLGIAVAEGGKGQSWLSVCPSSLVLLRT